MMLKLNTSNPGKLDEFQKFFKKYDVHLVATRRELKEIDADHLTVTLHKCGQVESGVLIEDSCLEVEGEDVGVNVPWRSRP